MTIKSIRAKQEPMISNSKKIKELFTDIAPTYDLLNRAMSGSIDQLWRKRAVSYLPKKKNLKILDLCAGTLDLSLATLKKFSDAEVIALDFAKEMLEKGKTKIPKRFQNQIHCIVGDGMFLPFPYEHFDAVLCGFGMRNIPDNAKALAEIYRVLKPNGKIIILEFFKPSKLSSKLFYATYGKWIIPKLGNWISKNPNAYQYLFESIQSYYSVKEFRKILEESKFSSIQEQPLTASIASIIVGEKTESSK